MSGAEARGSVGHATSPPARGPTHPGATRVRAIEAACRRAGGGASFVDPDFPPVAASVGSSERLLSKVVSWRRPIEFVEADPGTPATAPALFGDVSPADVVQGRLGDCWWLSNMAALALDKERLPFLTGMFYPDTYSAVGAYAVKFFRRGQFITVVIDDHLPCGEDGLPTFARVNDSGDIWAMLLEKAAAKLCGGYENLISGRPEVTVESLTGGTAREVYLPIEPSDTQLAASWAALVHARGRKKLMGCCSRPYKQADGTVAPADAKVPASVAASHGGLDEVSLDGDSGDDSSEGGDDGSGDGGGDSHGGVGVGVKPAAAVAVATASGVVAAAGASASAGGSLTPGTNGSQSTDVGGVLNKSRTAGPTLWLRLKVAASSKFKLHQVVLPNGIVSGHTYGILDVRELEWEGTTHRLIQIRNPWGHVQWNGPFGQDWDGWTPELIAELDERVEDDGTFWMPLADFHREFDYFFHCRVLSGDFTHLRAIDGAWAPNKSSGGPPGTATFSQNPAFLLYLSEAGHVVMRLFLDRQKLVGFVALEDGVAVEEPAGSGVGIAHGSSGGSAGTAGASGADADGAALGGSSDGDVDEVTYDGRPMRVVARSGVSMTPSRQVKKDVTWLPAGQYLVVPFELSPASPSAGAGAGADATAAAASRLFGSGGGGTKTKVGRPRKLGFTLAVHATAPLDLARATRGRQTGSRDTRL